MIKQVEQMVARANFSLRPDVWRLLKKAHRAETSKKAKKALSWILENANIAAKEKLAICQDTGFPMVFIEAGKGVKISSYLVDKIKGAVERSYAKNYLRPSIVDPLRRSEPSYKGVICQVDFSGASRGLKITIFPKGFGSENKSRLKMFDPTASYGDIEQFVLASVKQAGPEGCPPFVVGVGIGGTSDVALFLAKKSLMGEIDRPNPDKLLNSLEKKWRKKINSLNIGPMGLGGKITALAVKITTAATHIAGLPVGINISCWALRSASVTIK